MSDKVSRRVVLQIAGAGAATAGATACSRGPREHIVPYVNQPPEVTPSVPSHYATVTSLDGYGVGVLAESHVGRPTKLEGNPLHPASVGALGTIEQASLYDLYDPNRMRAFSHAGLPRTWEAFVSAVAAKPPPGKQTHVLLEPTSAPHLVDLVQRLRERGDTVVRFDSAVSRQNAWLGAKLVFGRVVEPRYAFARADVVLALDADFLAAVRSPHAWTRAWASRRRMNGPGDTMSRLYVVEPRLTVTGMAADDRLAIPGRRIEALLADLVAEVVTLRGRTDIPNGRTASPWGRAVARDLAAHAGASLVLVGDGQPPEVHALAHALNDVLGNVGHTVNYGASPIFEAEESARGLESLVQDIDAGHVATLVVVGGDPLYTAPADFDFSRRLASVPVTAYVGLRNTRTARACSWTCAKTHWLEAWSDALAFDGTPAIAQPLVEPLVDGRSPGQVLAAMIGHPNASSLELVQSHWREHTVGGFDAFWRESLVHGVVPTGNSSSAHVALDWNAVAGVLDRPASPEAPLEVAFFVDAKVDDGRFGDNAWLQELPDPVTKLTWDNAALLAPSTAKALDVDDGAVATLNLRNRSVRAPVLIVPGMADGVVGLALGYGQDAPGRASHDVGTNGYALRDSRALWFDDVTVTRTGDRQSLALAQEHSSMEDRPIAVHRRLDEYRRDPGFAKSLDATPESLYELSPDASHQWGMTIDLNACTGCSACVVACMVENNIPTVGRGGIRLGRGMYWMRIDRYYTGDPREPAAIVQPMLCQHCEKAPCEYVCPVNATVHSHDGLNEMIYNRCVGTRFCSNNCPYKVRRFNFFNYNVGKPDLLQLAMNPDVTVRARGVMEKCTYCVQRIRESEIAAGRKHRRLADGEIVTACQQTCPTGAIAFGDIADPKTEVSKTRRNDRLYEVLESLGTLPRTRYLARIVNPNADLRKA